MASAIDLPDVVWCKSGYSGNNGADCLVAQARFVAYAGLQERR